MVLLEPRARATVQHGGIRGDQLREDTSDKSHMLPTSHQPATGTGEEVAPIAASQPRSPLTLIAAPVPQQTAAGDTVPLP